MYRVFLFVRGVQLITMVIMMIRDRWRYQNRWIFKKVPNSL